MGDTFKTKGKVVIVGFFDAESDEAKVLTEVAEANRETVVMGQVQDKEVSVDGTEYGKLYMFRDFGEPIVAYSGDVSVEGITEFLNAERFPLIDAIGPEDCHWSGFHWERMRLSKRRLLTVCCHMLKQVR